MRGVWDRLEQVGAGELHPRLVTAQGLSARYLSRLPIAQQDKYLTNRFDVAVGEDDVLKVDLNEMTTEYRRQVFDTTSPSHIKVRTIAQQRAWLAQEKVKTTAEKTRLNRMTSIDRPGLYKI